MPGHRASACHILYLVCGELMAHEAAIHKQSANTMQLITNTNRLRHPVAGAEVNIQHSSNAKYHTAHTALPALTTSATICTRDHLFTFARLLVFHFITEAKVTVLIGADSLTGCCCGYRCRH